MQPSPIAETSREFLSKFALLHIELASFLEIGAESHLALNYRIG